MNAALIDPCHPVVFYFPQQARRGYGLPHNHYQRGQALGRELSPDGGFVDNIKGIGFVIGSLIA